MTHRTKYYTQQHCRLYKLFIQTYFYFNKNKPFLVWLLLKSAVSIQLKRVKVTHLLWVYFPFTSVEQMCYLYLIQLSGNSWHIFKKSNSLVFRLAR